MRHETIVILKTEPRYLPLYWTGWSLNWRDDGLGCAKAVCHLLMPDNPEHRERLIAVYLRGKPVPCVLKDPVLGTWYWFDAYLAACDLHSDPEVTLLTDGEVREGVPLPPQLRTPRQQRKDAGRPRKPRPASTASEEKE